MPKAKKSKAFPGSRKANERSTPGGLLTEFRQRKPVANGVDRYKAMLKKKGWGK